MKKFILLLIIPFLSFSQSGDTNGDGFTNLEDLFNVLDDWLQNVNDNDPEAISNLDEMTNLVDSLITLNQNVNYGISIEGWVEHNYQFTNCCDSSLGGGACENNENNYYSVTDCADFPIINTAEKSGLLLIRQHMFCNSLNVYVNDDLIVQDYGAFGEPEVHKIITVPIKKGDEFILTQSCASYNLWNNNGTPQRLDFFSFGDSNASNTNQSNSNNQNNSTLLINNSEYLSLDDCNYINSLDYGSIVHNALIGQTFVVLPGKQCGSSQIDAFSIISSSGYNYYSARDFLLCFSVNDTIALTNLPPTQSGGTTRIYLLEDSIIDYNPNIDTDDDSDQFINSAVFEVMSSQAPKEIILFPGNIYGFRMDHSGVLSMQYGVNIQTSESINNLGVWQNQSPDYEWELTTNFPNIGSLQYYPYGKSIKTF